MYIVDGNDWNLQKVPYEGSNKSAIATMLGYDFLPVGLHPWEFKLDNTNKTWRTKIRNVSKSLKY
jgi:hypothetical protein